MTLSREGLQVFSAANLNSALLQLRVLQPDLIIISGDCPAQEPSDAERQIRALSAAPLLMLTGSIAANIEPGGARSSLFNVEKLRAAVACAFGERDTDEPHPAISPA